MQEILYYFGRLESLYQQIVSDADIVEGIDSINPDFLLHNISSCSGKLRNPNSILNEYREIYAYILDIASRYDVGAPLTKESGIWSHDFVGLEWDMAIRRILSILSSEAMNNVVALGFLQQVAMILKERVELKAEPENSTVACMFIQRAHHRLRLPSFDSTFAIQRLLDLAKMLYNSSSLAELIYGGYFHLPFRAGIHYANATQESAMLEELQQGIKYADLAYWVPSKTGNPTAFVNPYRIDFSEVGVNINGKFHFPNNFNGYLGWIEEEKKTIVVGYSGSEMTFNPNWITNFCQYFRGPDEVYNMAMEMLRSVVWSRNHNPEFQDCDIKVFGHSLGGGLMQYAIANNPGRDIKGYGYNSAGLSYKTLGCCIHVNNAIDNVSHLYLPDDLVFKLPFGNQLGTTVALPSKEPNFKTAHRMECIRQHATAHGQEVAELL